MDQTYPESKGCPSPEVSKGKRDSRPSDRTKVQRSTTSAQPRTPKYESLTGTALGETLEKESVQKARQMPNLFTPAHSAIPEANLHYDQARLGLVGPTSDNSRKLFFKPLNKHSTRDQVLQCLEKFGRVEYLRVPYSNKKKKNLGYGFVIFQSSTVSDLLHRHQMKTRIGDKAVGFYKFDLLKYKSKKTEEGIDSLHKEEKPIEDVKFTSIALLESESKLKLSELEHKGHYVKPTQRKLFSVERHVTGSTKYRLNLETLKMKILRDTSSCISQLKKGSVKEVIKPKW